MHLQYNAGVRGTASAPTLYVTLTSNFGILNIMYIYAVTKIHENRPVGGYSSEI
jgi:hypothetical protein